MHIAVVVLLFAASFFALAGAVGVCAMRDPFQRLHYIALPSGLSGALITVAVLLEEQQKAMVLKVALIALVLFALNGVISHATARAAWTREHGELPGPRE